MVEKEIFKGKESFRCEECSFHYEEKSMAEECEEHCRDYDACDTRIAKNSLERSA